jgi:TDG/mug DNA glycosylase family protein
VSGDVLPDLLAPGLRVVFCGTAAGAESARRGAYYAGPGNRFWTVLQEAGFTPRRFRPEEFPGLLALGIGLTDLAKRASGVDKSLRPSDFDGERTRAAIRMWRPSAIAFTSATAARVFLGRDAGFGELTPSPAFAGEGWGGGLAFRAPRLFVLPSPSGANGHWARQRHHWHDAARALGFAA